MKLYHCSNARSLRPLWTLEELDLEYELVTMEFPPRHKYPNYLKINPLGTVPTFVVPKGSSQSSSQPAA